MESNYIPAFSYNFLTPCYDALLDLLGFGTNQRVKIVRLLDLKPGNKLLDVGCGTGSLLLEAKKLHPNTYMAGLDIDKRILEIAERKFKRGGVVINLIESGVNRLPFPNSSFDVVVSTLIFHHLQTDVKKDCLKEVYRVLKKKGVFLLADFGKAEGVVKLIYHLEGFFGIPEYKTAKDNAEGKLPKYFVEAGFETKEVLPKYRGIYYWLSKKG